MTLKSLLLMPFSWLFACLVALKNMLYDRNLCTIRHLPQPVISVGNLSMGGAGKTPFCMELLGKLHQQGHQVTVLSRGYGRIDKRTSRRVDLAQHWRYFGDEPTMIARRFPQFEVCVGPTRYDAASLATNADLFLIDDGFQHRQMARDVDIVLIDATQGPPRLFPLGLFREPFSSLARAHMAVITRAEDPEATHHLHRCIRAANADISIHHTRFAAGSVCNDESSRPLSKLKGERVAAFSGISHPEKFFGTLASFGAHIAIKMALRDHEPMGTKRLDHLLTRCRQEGIQWVLMTEKDWVKLEKRPKSAIFLGFLTMKVVWEDEEAFYQSLNAKLK